MVQWGSTSFGERKGFPQGVKVKYVECGDYYSVAIKEDGTMVQWGSKYAKELQGFPQGVKVKYVACGWNHSVAIKEDGTMVQWGNRSEHQMDGFPAGVKVKQVSCGSDFSVAIKEDGTMVQWGQNNQNSMLGFPAGVKVKYVACGGYKTTAIKEEDGWLVQWGNPKDLDEFDPPVSPPSSLKFFDAPAPSDPIVNGLQKRKSSTFNEHLTTILPKGTLLFRGVRNVAQFDDDLMGVKMGDPAGTKSNTCMSPFYAVYFYPFPFADSTVGRYEHYGVYVTTRDITLLCLISPSPMTRGDRFAKDTPITTCSNIDVRAFGCGLIGRHYDACLKPEYLKEFPDVTGTLAIANEDRRKFQEVLKFEREQLEPEEMSPLVTTLGTYVFPYLDSVDKTKQGGIPEIVLHPFNRALQAEYTTQRTSLAEYIGNHKQYLNYQPLVVIKRDEDLILDMMKALTSPAGFTIDPASAPVHAKINPSTGFFQLVELSDPASLNDSQPFRFARPPATTGSGRLVGFAAGRGRRLPKV